MNIDSSAAFVALTATGCFLAACCAAHYTRRDDLGLAASMSQYLTDSTRRLMLLGYIALMIALAATVVAVWLSQGASFDVYIFAAFFSLAALSLLVAGGTAKRNSVGADERGAITIRLHRQAGTLAFVTATLGTLTYSINRIFFEAFTFELELLALSGLIGGLCFMAVCLKPRHYGVVQKSLVAAIAVWILMLAGSIVVVR